MLSVRPRITDLAFHLFAQEVHPELFEVCASRTIQREEYQLELNITTDGHVLRFRRPHVVLAEVASGAHHPLPNAKQLLHRPIEGHWRGTHSFQNLIEYQTEVQIEIVKPSLFIAVQRQLDERMECQGLVHRFGSNGRLSFGALSYMHVQAFRQHVLIRAFHTFPESSSILTSESRFSLS